MTSVQIRTSAAHYVDVHYIQNEVIVKKIWLENYCDIQMKENIVDYFVYTSCAKTRFIIKLLEQIRLNLKTRNW